MKYCEDCGKQIPDDANTCPHCGAFQDAVSITPKKKRVPVALWIVLGAVLLLAAAAAVFCFTRKTESHTGPLDALCVIASDTLNGADFTADTLRDAAAIALGTTGAEDVDAIVDTVSGMEFDGSPILTVAQDALTGWLDENTDFGDDVTVTYEVLEETPLQSDALTAYAETYGLLGSCGKEIAQQVDLFAELIAGQLKLGITGEELHGLCANVSGLGKTLEDEIAFTEGYEMRVRVHIEGTAGSTESEVTVSVLKLNDEWVLSCGTEDLQALREELEDFNLMDFAGQLM